MIISIVGLPGVGKTTFGRLLAQSLRFDFVDLDQAIEAHERAAIADIFSTHGEGYFRSQEKNMLKLMLEKNNLVLATGGGTPAYFDNMNLMKQHGVVIYLQDNLESIVNRLKKDQSNRPLFLGLNEHQLSTKLDTLFKKRISHYRQSHIITGFEASTSIQLFTNRLDLFTK